MQAFNTEPRPIDDTAHEKANNKPQCGMPIGRILNILLLLWALTTIAVSIGHCYHYGVDWWNTTKITSNLSISIVASSIELAHAADHLFDEMRQIAKLFKTIMRRRIMNVKARAQSIFFRENQNYWMPPLGI